MFARIWKWRFVKATNFIYGAMIKACRLTDVNKDKRHLLEVLFTRWHDEESCKYSVLKKMKYMASNYLWQKLVEDNWVMVDNIRSNWSHNVQVGTI